MFAPRLMLLFGTALLMSACSHSKYDIAAGGGAVVKRSACPAVAVLVNAGDETLFSVPNTTDSRAIDVVANMTNLHADCIDSGSGDILSRISFAVQGRRSNPSGDRDVTLSYFSAVMQGGKTLVAKDISQVTLHFADGKYQAQTQGTATGKIDRASATIPVKILNDINRRRKPTEDDAAIDPLSDPANKAAIAKAIFEVILGFQLTEDQLKYNATR
jgi:hypothetical protein